MPFSRKFTSIGIVAALGLIGCQGLKSDQNPAYGAGYEPARIPNAYYMPRASSPAINNELPIVPAYMPTMASMPAYPVSYARPQPLHLPQFQQWVDYKPEYKLYPGDQIDIVVSSAPELSRTLTVGPDGRIVMPMTQPIMAAGKTFGQVQRELSAQLSKQLRDPRIAITPRAYSPQQIFVGGEVGTQGTYTMPGPIGVTEALLMAGGLQPSARTGQVAVLRRAPNGGMMLRTINLGNRNLRPLSLYDDNLQLHRGDIIFVPRTTMAEVGNWSDSFRRAMPVNFNLSYQFNDDNNGNGTTVIAP